MILAVSPSPEAGGEQGGAEGCTDSDRQPQEKIESGAALSEIDEDQDGSDSQQRGAGKDPLLSHATYASWNARARNRKSMMLPSWGCNQLS